MATRIGGRVRLTPAAAQIVSLCSGGASFATGIRRSASLTSPQMTPASAPTAVIASPPSPPPVNSAMRCVRRSVTAVEISGYLTTMRYSESVVDLIGNTPLVRLRCVTERLAPTVLAKLEYFNPGGSVKDRIAVRMVEAAGGAGGVRGGAAEASGELRAGGTIVELTSGNTGVGLAIVAQRRGYHCVFVCPDKVSRDKIATLRAYGAEVIVCPTAVAPEDPRSYSSVSDRLARERPGGWKPDQYSNVNNPLS